MPRSTAAARRASAAAPPAEIVAVATRKRSAATAASEARKAESKAKPATAKTTKAAKPNKPNTSTDMKSTSVQPAHSGASVGTESGTRRQRVLRAAVARDASELHACLRPCDKTQMKELMETLTPQQVSQLFTGLSFIIREIVLTHFVSDMTQSAAEVIPNATLQAFDHLLSAATLCQSLLETEMQVVPPEVQTCVQQLHEIIFSLPACQKELRDCIGKLCEQWWYTNQPNRELIVPQTFSLLLMKSLHEENTAAAAKRVYDMREALNVLNLEDEQSASIKGLMLGTFISSAFLSNTEGRRFCSFIFGLQIDYMRTIHQFIKNTLPHCSSERLADYGEIYYRCWRTATGELLDAFEIECIQDLIEHGVHAARAKQGGVDMARIIRTVLDGFHSQKRERGVDDMLTRLCEPIIWRALKVANPVVRANAAALLVAAFPLQSAELSRSDSERLMQQQFDALQALIIDDCPVVRATGVEGVFRIANAYWELIPREVLIALLSTIVQDMARDGTSHSVRLAVVKGFTFLLDNHQALSFLKKLLPNLKQMIHDPATAVRAAFVKLLLTVKGVRDIKFYDVVPVEDLLARLEVDSDKICNDIVTVLLSSFFPSKADDDTRVQRCLALMRDHRTNGRAFYYHLCRSRGNTGTNELAHFAHVLGSHIAAVEDMTEDNDNGLTKADVPLLLEVIAVVVKHLQGIHEDGSNTMKKLAVALGPMLDYVENNYDAQSVELSLSTLITACLPLAAKRIDIIEKVKELARPDLTDVTVRATVDWLLARGQAELLLSTVDFWLSTALTGKAPASSKANAKASRLGKSDSVQLRDLALSARGDCGPQALRVLQLVLAAAAASSESCEVDWVTLMQPLAATLQQVPKFFLLGSQEERDSNALDADVSTLGRLAVEVQVFATPNMKALAKFVLELISVAEKFAGRSAGTFSEKAPLPADKCAAVMEQVLSSVAGMVRVGRAEEMVVTKAISLCGSMVNNGAQFARCARVIASLCSQLAQRTHGSDAHEDDGHITRLLQYFVSAAISQSETTASIANALSLLLLSVAKVYQRRQRLAPFIGVLAEQCLRLISEYDSTLALGLSASMPQEKLAVFSVFRRFVLRTESLTEAFLDALATAARQSSEENAVYHAAQIAALFYQDEAHAGAAILAVLRSKARAWTTLFAPAQAEQDSSSENADPLVSGAPAKIRPKEASVALNTLLSILGEA